MSELELLSLLMADHMDHLHHVSDHDRGDDDDVASSATDCDDLGHGHGGDGSEGSDGGGILGYSSASSASSTSSSSMHLAERVMRCLNEEEAEEDECDHRDDDDGMVVPRQGNNHAQQEGPELAPESGLTRASFRRLWLGAGCESEVMARGVGVRVQRADTEWYHHIQPYIHAHNILNLSRYVLSHTPVGTPLIVDYPSAPLRIIPSPWLLYLVGTTPTGCRL